MKRLAEFIIKWKYPVLIVIGIITVFFLYEIKNLKINSDWSTYLKKDDPTIKLSQYVGEKFSGNVTAIVAVEADNVFSPKVLSAIASLTRALESVEGINSVTSLTSIIDIRNVDGILEVRNLIDNESIPEDSASLDSLRNYVLSKDMYSGRIVSADGKLTMIVCLLDHDADEESVARKIKEIASKYQGRLKIYYAGIPMQMLELNRIIRIDLYRLVPFAIIALILMFYLNFGDFKSVFLPLVSVVISTIWCIGIMVISGVKFSIVSNALPVVLITVGSAYGVHLVAHFRELRRGISDRKELIKTTLMHVGIPIFLAAVTTIVGFISFIGSYLTIITEFGIFSAIGVLIALLISLTLIPILLYFVSRRTFNERSILDKPLEKLLLSIKRIVLHHNKWIIIVFAIIILVSIAGLPLLERDSNIMRYFKKDTEIRVAEDLMKKYFGGSYTVQILVKGDMRDPAVLKKIMELEKYLNSIKNISKAQSVADYICEMNRVMNGHYTIPESRDGVANLYFFIENEPIMEQMVDRDYKEGLVQARIYTLDTGEIIKLVDAVNAYIKDSLNTRLVYARRDIIKNKTFLDSLAIEQAAKKVLYDLEEYNYAGDSDFVDIKVELENGLKRRSYPYNEERKKKLHTRLEDFFMYESAIAVEEENLFRQLVGGFVDLISMGTPPDIESIWDVFNATGAGNNFDREELKLTVESLYDIWTDFFNRARVDYIAHKLGQIYSFGESENIYQDVMSDLWVLNENVILLPDAVARKYGIEGRPIKLEMEQTGSATIFKRLDESIVKSQVKSLIIAIVLVYFLLMVQLRSFKGGLFALVPIVVTILFNFAIMAYTGTPLDTATVMIASIAIGIGIDYSIHFINRFKMEFSHNRSVENILETTLLTTGKAILVNAISVIAGFLVLIFGELAPVQRFGWLISITMVVSMLGALTVLPALLISTRAKFIGDFSAVKFFNRNRKRRDKQ